jgi:hypothetical protein
MGKKKGDTKGSDGGSDAKAPKPATHVNVRHILCEKHSKVRSMHSLTYCLAAAVSASRSQMQAAKPATHLVTCVQQIVEAQGRIQAGEQFSQVAGCTHADMVQTAGAACVVADASSCRAFCHR